MLVLSRKTQERIRIGDDVVITIVRIACDKVRVGIDAPREMRIIREELETPDGKEDAQAQAPPQRAAA